MSDTVQVIVPSQHYQASFGEVMFASLPANLTELSVTGCDQPGSRSQFQMCTSLPGIARLQHLQGLRHLSFHRCFVTITQVITPISASLLVCKPVQLLCQAHSSKPLFSVGCVVTICMCMRLLASQCLSPLGTSRAYISTARHWPVCWHLVTKEAMMSARDGCRLCSSYH